MIVYGQAASSKVNVTGEGLAIVVEPTGEFDESAARLVSELVACARRACVRVVVDLGRLTPGAHAGLVLLPVIARSAIVRRCPRA